MKLVHWDSGEEIKVGDAVTVRGEQMTLSKIKGDHLEVMNGELIWPCMPRDIKATIVY